MGARLRHVRGVGVEAVDAVAVACPQRGRQRAIAAAEVDDEAPAHTRRPQDLSRLGRRLGTLRGAGDPWTEGHRGRQEAHGADSLDDA